MEGTRIAGFTVEREHGALKLMHPHLAGSPQLVQRFQREIEASAALSHPNIVRVLACGEDAGRFFVASEFVDGLLAREKGPPPVVVDLLVRAVGTPPPPPRALDDDPRMRGVE